MRVIVAVGGYFHGAKLCYCAYIGRHDDSRAVASRFKLEKRKLRICFEFDFGNQFHVCGYVAMWLFKPFFNVTFFF